MKKLLFALLLAGCATAPTFPEPNAQWETFHGQLQYVTAERSVIGEFTATQHASDFKLEFTKGGAVPLIKVQRSMQTARADGPLARGRWWGEAAKAPPPLRGWVDDVPRAFAGLEPLLRRVKNAAQPQINVVRSRPSRIEVPGPQPGEKFVFIFSR